MYRRHGKWIIKLLWDWEVGISFFLFNTAIIGNSSSVCSMTTLKYCPSFLLFRRKRQLIGIAHIHRGSWHKATLMLFNKGESNWCYRATLVSHWAWRKRTSGSSGMRSKRAMWQRVMSTWMQKMSEVQNRRPNTGQEGSVGLWQPHWEGLRGMNTLYMPVSSCSMERLTWARCPGEESAEVHFHIGFFKSLSEELTQALAGLPQKEWIASLFWGSFSPAHP